MPAENRRDAVPQDRDRWAELWRGYLDFYETRLPPENYQHTWQPPIAAESPIRGLGARLGSITAPVVAIPSFSPHAWTTLQDIFVDSAVRRAGCRRRLIEAVAAARDRRCCRLYWTTKDPAARSLCDRTARYNGLIRYDDALE